MHPDHFRMVRSTGLDARHDVDGLDRFLLACAGNGILVADLLARLPCSRQTATERTERLIALGYLTLWTVEASGDTQREEDAEAHERDTVRPRPSSGP